MKIALIGLPKSGKTYWSKRIADAGYERIDCEELIQMDMAMHMKDEAYRDDGAPGWVATPDGKGAGEREQHYLKSEAVAMKQVIDRLKENSEKHVVVDTAGSLVYLGKDVLEALKQEALLVHLETPSSFVEKMVDYYLEKKAPFVWVEHFSKHPGETDEQAVRRCYPDLLKWRAARYAEIADVVVSHDQHHDACLSAEDFLHVISKSQQQEIEG